MNLANERLDVLRQRLDTVAAEREAINSLDDRWNAAAEDLVAEEKKWDAERNEILSLANQVGPKFTAAKEEALAAAEKYIAARVTLAELDAQYSAILRRARAAGIEGDVPLIPAISADGAQINDEGYRIRRIVRGLQEMPLW